MSGALPIIPASVVCEPYRTALSPAACVARFRLANTRWTKEDGAGTDAAATALYRQSDCAGCCIVADRAWCYGNGGIEAMGERTQSVVKKTAAAIDAANRAGP